MTQELPTDISEGPAIKSINAQVESFLNTYANQVSEDNTSSQSDTSNSHQKPTHRNNVSEPVIRNDHWDAAGIPETPRNVDGTARENHGQTAPESVSGSPNAPREGQKEVIEQFEPGVYVTLLQLTNGTKIFKRVRFRYFTKFHLLLNCYFDCLYCPYPSVRFIWLTFLFSLSKEERHFPILYS